MGRSIVAALLYHSNRYPHAGEPMRQNATSTMPLPLILFPVLTLPFLLNDFDLI